MLRPPHHAHVWPRSSSRRLQGPLGFDLGVCLGDAGRPPAGGYRVLPPRRPRVLAHLLGQECRSL